jgi:hypothetical protein
MPQTEDEVLTFTVFFSEIPRPILKGNQPNPIFCGNPVTSLNESKRNRINPNQRSCMQIACTSKEKAPTNYFVSA